MVFKESTVIALKLTLFNRKVLKYWIWWQLNHIYSHQNTRCSWSCSYNNRPALLQLLVIQKNSALAPPCGVDVRMLLKKCTTITKQIYIPIYTSIGSKYWTIKTCCRCAYYSFWAYDGVKMGPFGLAGFPINHSSQRRCQMFQIMILRVCASEREGERGKGWR